MLVYRATQIDEHLIRLAMWLLIIYATVSTSQQTEISTNASKPLVTLDEPEAIVLG